MEYAELLKAFDKDPKGAWIAMLARAADSYKQESDRAAALLAAAMLDYQLGETIRNLLVDDKDASDRLLDSTRPLGTFSARIDLLYSLGHLPIYIRRAAHQIRSIRNEFAHHPEALSFTRSDIASKCASLFDEFNESIGQLFPAPRDRYLAGVTVCLFAARFSTKDLTHPPIPELIANFPGKPT